MRNKVHTQSPLHDVGALRGLGDERILADNADEVPARHKVQPDGAEQIDEVCLPVWW